MYIYIHIHIYIYIIRICQETLVFITNRFGFIYSELMIRVGKGLCHIRCQSTGWWFMVGWCTLLAFPQAKATWWFLVNGVPNRPGKKHPTYIYSIYIYSPLFPNISARSITRFLAGEIANNPHVYPVLGHHWCNWFKGTTTQFPVDFSLNQLVRIFDPRLNAIYSW